MVAFFRRTVYFNKEILRRNGDLFQGGEHARGCMRYELYYWPTILEDQKREARRRAADFLKSRAPKFLGYFEQLLGRNGRASYLNYAFPRAMGRGARKYRRLYALHARVQERPRIAAYLASPRRIPFNQDGIFRHYPELDAA